MMSDDVLLSSSRHFSVRDARAVADIALLAGGLLACLDAPLLTIERCADRLLPVMIWGDRLAPCRRRTATLYTTPLLSPALNALHVAAAPPHGTSSDCIITDGTGVAVVAGYPRPDLGWLIDAVRDTGGVVVQPFDADSLWTLLRTERDVS